MTIRPGWDWLRAHSWVETTALLESAELEQGRDSEGDAVYWIAVRFSYGFHGQAFVGTKYGFREGRTNVGVGGLKRIVASLEKNHRTTCWVNPEMPTEAVLDRSLPHDFFTGIFFSLPFLTVGFGGIALILGGAQFLRFHRSRRAAQLAGLERQGVAVWSGSRDVDIRTGAGRVVIFARDVALGRALAVTGLNFFWNGIVGVFLSVVVIEWMGGKIEWFLILFLTPFVAVGAAMFFAVVQAWRSFFCKNFVVVISPVPHLAGCTVGVAVCPLPPDPMSSVRPFEARLVALATPEKQGSPGKSLRSLLGFYTGGFRPVPESGILQKREHVLAAIEIPGSTGTASIRLPSVPHPSPVEPGAAWHRGWQLEVKDERNRVRTFEIAGGVPAPPLIL